VSSVSPESPEWAAYKITSGPGDLDSKIAAVERLVAQFPGNTGVSGYLESLHMQKELSEAPRARVDASPDAPGAPEA
jgi:hypothetical protein